MENLSNGVLGAEEAAEKLWDSPVKAFYFLVFSGILNLPALCPDGHKMEEKDYFLLD